jgi:hypothetical protein
MWLETHTLCYAPLRYAVLKLNQGVSSRLAVLPCACSQPLMYLHLPVDEILGGFCLSSVKTRSIWECRRPGHTRAVVVVAPEAWSQQKGGERPMDADGSRHYLVFPLFLSLPSFARRTARRSSTWAGIKHNRL